jgi:hypothetical protein
MVYDKAIKKIFKNDLVKTSDIFLSDFSNEKSFLIQSSSVFLISPTSVMKLLLLHSGTSY